MKTFNNGREDYEINIEYINKSLKHAEKLFNDDRISEAFALVKIIDLNINKLYMPKLEEIKIKVANLSVIQNIRRCGQQIDSFLGLINQSESWKPWNTKEEKVKVSTYKDEIKGKYYFMVEGTLQASIENIIASFLEVELYTTWVRNV
jgi:hypothetical protein